jgi:nucleoside-diphosphate kinase
MANERTLIILKPDAVQRGLIGELIGRLERRGLKFVALKLMQIDRDLAERHYGEHKGKPFYEGLVEYITSGPVVVGVVEGPSAIAAVSGSVGATNPINSAPGTIRGDFAVSIGRNLIHRSDGAETAAREISIFFTEGEVTSWSRDTDRWIFEE